MIRNTLTRIDIVDRHAVIRTARRRRQYVAVQQNNWNADLFEDGKDSCVCLIRIIDIFKRFLFIQFGLDKGSSGPFNS